MTTEIVDQHHPFPEEQTAMTPMELMQIAVTKGTSVEQLSQLMELQFKWEKNEARKAFVSAMNEFKANPPEILKNKHVAYKEVAYDHATLDHVCKVVTAELSKHGISHRWRIEQEPALIRVTCILTHNQGHSEETTLSAGADATGSKNAVQAIGSTVTYLERYTLLAATGLAAKNGDTDAIPEMENLQLYLDRMMAADNLNILDRAFKDAFKEAVAQNNTQAMKAIVAAKDERKAILAKEKLG